MDLAYDHIQESALPKDADKKKGDSKDTKNDQPQASLNEDLQEAYKALSTSAWGMRIGGFLGNAVKQGQSVYKEASKEVAELGEDAAKGFTSIVNRTRSLTVNTVQGEPSGDKGKEADNQTTPTATRDQAAAADDAMSNSETYMTKFRAEAARRLKELQKAEDAADEALLRFGTNISNFLKEAVSIAPPSDAANQSGAVLFESKDAQGKRVIHTSRQDAQLHVIHTSTESFTTDPATEEFSTWGKAFDVESKTGDISDDLKKYPELRTTMEKLVPDQVPYAEFWKRYYFLRHGMEAAEARRRDLLKAASAEDEVGWDESDSEESDSDEPDAAPAPAAAAKAEQKKPARPPSTESSTTIQPPPAQTSQSTLKPTEARKSNDEKSQADSEASYDVVGAASGVPSRAPNSPKEARKAEESSDDSDDSDSDADWE